MRIYLVRHGEALSKIVDSQCRLSPRGINEANVISKFLKPLGIKVESIQHSGKARAAQTAEILSKVIIAEKGLTGRSGLAPSDPVEDIALEINMAESDLMIVSHLPFLDKLAGYLLTGEADTSLFNFDCAGILCLGREGKLKWNVEWAVNPTILYK